MAPDCPRGMDANHNVRPFDFNFNSFVFSISSGDLMNDKVWILNIKLYYVILFLFLWSQMQICTLIGYNYSRNIKFQVIYINLEKWSHMLYVCAIILRFKKCETQHVEYVKNRAQNYWCVTFLIVKKVKLNKWTKMKKQSSKYCKQNAFYSTFTYSQTKYSTIFHIFSKFLI